MARKPYAAAPAGGECGWKNPRPSARRTAADGRDARTGRSARGGRNRRRGPVYPPAPLGGGRVLLLRAAAVQPDGPGRRPAHLGELPTGDAGGAGSRSGSGAKAAKAISQPIAGSARRHLTKLYQMQDVASVIGKSTFLWFDRMFIRYTAVPEHGEPTDYVHVSLKPGDALASPGLFTGCSSGGRVYSVARSRRVGRMEAADCPSWSRPAARYCRPVARPCHRCPNGAWACPACTSCLPCLSPPSPSKLLSSGVQLDILSGTAKNRTTGLPHFAGRNGSCT